MSKTERPSLLCVLVWTSLCWQSGWSVNKHPRVSLEGVPMTRWNSLQDSTFLYIVCSWFHIDHRSDPAHIIYLSS